MSLRLLNAIYSNSFSSSNRVCQLLTGIPIWGSFCSGKPKKNQNFNLRRVRGSETLLR